MRRRLAFGGIFFLSVATLMFEINLTRLFSVAQFYHFAFMIISLAMLGFGSSGTLLALFPRAGQRHPNRTLAWLALGYGFTSAGGYVLTNFLPFDSFSIAWDCRQVFILLLHYLVLALPFFCCGAGLSLMFVLYPQSVGYMYATNLTGSAVGCLLALFIPALLGGQGLVWLSALIGGICALLFLGADDQSADCRGRGLWKSLKAQAISGGLGTAVALGLIVVCGLILIVDPTFLELRLSPYKSLSYALQFPDAHVVFRRWNSFSRVDVVQSGGIRSLPGLSYRYLAPPPPQLGLFVDAGQLNPVLQSPAAPTAAIAFTFTDFLPEAVAYQLRPDAQALVLDPKGGLALWLALAQGASSVTAIEANPLVVDAVGSVGLSSSTVTTSTVTASPYAHPQVVSILEHPRSFARRTSLMPPGSMRYDVTVLALNTPYHPIRSGAYSLAEDYRYTVEAFEDYLACLKPDGIFVVTRWLQMPPSESLRAFALAVTALEQRGGDPAYQIVAFRGYATLTMLVKVEPFTSSELTVLRRFLKSRAFDLVYAPDIKSVLEDSSDLGEGVNQFNILSEPLYYSAFRALLNAEDRDAWYDAYPFDITPPTDNHPFFGHFFKWSQARQVLAELGKQWQPFGGAGYFVLVVLLALALIAAVILMLVPLVVVRRGRGRLPSANLQGFRKFALYFALLGLGYLFVEIPLLQQFILFLGHPAYSMTSVLFALLLFSGLGSAYARRLEAGTAVSLSRALVGLVVLVFGYALGLHVLFATALRLPLLGRVLVAVLAIAPLGFLMGLPFPGGIRRLEAKASWCIPWAWGINGAVSVVASVLAALLALSFGFTFVLIGGALCYVGAWLIARQPW